MKTPDSPATNATAPRVRPTRALAAVVALLLAGVAGWWAYANAVPRPASASDFRADPREGGGRRGGFFLDPAPRQREAVSVAPRTVTVRDGDMTLSTTLRGEQNWTINVTFGGESLGGREAMSLLRAVRRLLDSRVPPASLKLTDTQRAALAAIPLTPPELTDAQRARLIELLNRSQKLTAAAPEMAALKAELSALAAEIKTLDRAAANARHAERDTRLRAVLSPEQVQALLGPRGSAPAAP